MLAIIPMITVSDIFLNGVAGVFTGIALLYLMMKLLAVTLGRPAADPPDRTSGTG